MSIRLLAKLANNKLTAFLDSFKLLIQFAKEVYFTAKMLINTNLSICILHNVCNAKNL